MPNKKAKLNKQRKRRIEESLAINGRTAKQYKKRKLRKESKDKRIQYGI
tara:strand:+ start:379 stop:525 length:147 start_codon:yes stop_codon:yes gene_type:complete